MTFVKTDLVPQHWRRLRSKIRSKLKVCDELYTLSKENVPNLKYHLEVCPKTTLPLQPIIEDRTCIEFFFFFFFGLFVIVDGVSCLQI